MASAFAPALNEEHSEWRWHSWASLGAGSGDGGGELHPVVKLLVQEHAAEVEAVLQACSATPGQGGGR